MVLPATLVAKDRETIQKMDQSVNRLTWIVVAIGLLVAGTIWHIGQPVVAALSQKTSATDYFGIGLIGVALGVFLWGMVKQKR